MIKKSVIGFLFAAHVVCALVAEIDLAGTWRLERADDPSVACEIAVPGGALTVSAKDSRVSCSNWIGADLPGTFASGAAVPTLDVTGPRSVCVEGDYSRFERVWARLERSEPCRIVVIGGSITQGARASKSELQWGSRFAEGWRRAFQKSRIDLVNAGIGATGSDIGAFRLQRDVLSRKPDVVVVEFSVNDDNTRDRAESYEGIVRQLLKAREGIAVMLLGMVSKSGASAQEWHGKVAAHYGVPFVSYRDALYPFVKNGSMSWSDISPDSVHPNDIGHAYAAALLNWTLERHYRRWVDSGRPKSPVAKLPSPLFGTRYDQGEFLRMADAKIVANDGFFPLRDNCWGEGLACTNANGRLVFEVEGEMVSLLYRCGNKPYNWGKITVKLDGENVVGGLDCYRDQWWWKTPALPLCRDKPGRHTVEVLTLLAKDEKSDGYGCHLTGLLVSGEHPVNISGSTCPSLGYEEKR